MVLVTTAIGFYLGAQGAPDYLVLLHTLIGRAKEVMERLYKPLALRNAPLIFVNRESAELAKYAANAFLAMKISFINEIADLCESAGANVQEVATAIGADGRIGGKFLHPGPGYGGSCFPKDVAALIRTAREARSPLSLIEQVQTVNSERKISLAGRIERAAGGPLAGKTVAVLGIAFKPDTDDVRDFAEPGARADVAGTRRDRQSLRSACESQRRIASCLASLGAIARSMRWRAPTSPSSSPSGTSSARSI